MLWSRGRSDPRPPALGPLPGAALKSSSEYSSSSAQDHSAKVINLHCRGLVVLNAET